MAILQHSTLPHASVHEPKWVSINGTSSSGKVITNSSSSTGVSEYRQLAQNDISNLEVLWMVKEYDGTVTQTHYIPASFSGVILKWGGIVNTPLATGNNTYQLEIDGVLVTASPITFTTGAGTGGTAGDIVEASPSAANVFADGSVVTIVNTASLNTDAALDIQFVITVKRA